MFHVSTPSRTESLQKHWAPLNGLLKPSGTCVEKLAKMFPASKTVPLKRPDVFDPLEDCVALPAQKKKGSRIKPINVKVIVMPKNSSPTVHKGKQTAEAGRGEES